MKPYQLIAALMHKHELGALPLAKAMNRPKLQPQIHRFIKGAVKEPARTTAEPLAAFFKIPTEAIYSEAVATKVAKELGITALPEPAPVPPAVERHARSPARDEFDAETIRIARQFARLNAEERKKFKTLLKYLAPEPKHPDPSVWRRPDAADRSEPFDTLAGGISNLGEFQDEPHHHHTKKQPKGGQK